jgi:trigger factor
MSNQVTVSALERRIDMSVPLAEIDKDVETRLKKMARTVKMPGFRPGKVPFRMVAQSYGPLPPCSRSTPRSRSPTSAGQD